MLIWMIQLRIILTGQKRKKNYKHNNSAFQERQYQANVI